MLNSLRPLDIALIVLCLALVILILYLVNFTPMWYRLRVSCCLPAYKFAMFFSCFLDPRLILAKRCFSTKAVIY